MASMSFQKNIDKVVNDVKDTFSEAKHRSIADAEQTQRDVAGDEMTAGEKAASMVNQAKHGTQAEMDAAKRKMRDGV
jgi:F0F1-type ATP synthase membrane subunit b/b'